MMTALVARWNRMKIMWNREKATRSAQNTVLWMIIAVLKWTLLTVVVIGKDKMKCGKVEVLHTFDADGEIFLQNYLVLLAMQGKRYSLRSTELFHYRYN
jgi:hypothetical protein